MLFQDAFGESIKEVRQVDGQEKVVTAAAVNSHLDMLRPAIKSYGGKVEVFSHLCASPVPKGVLWALKSS